MEFQEANLAERFQKEEAKEQASTEDPLVPYSIVTLSLRLFPPLCGFFVIVLHISNIIIVVSGCPVTLSGSNKWHATHMTSTSLAAIFEELVY
ncbi:hypothetical protein Peur_003509 [Populus x canadensis]